MAGSGYRSSVATIFRTGLLIFLPAPGLPAIPADPGYTVTPESAALSAQIAMRMQFRQEFRDTPEEMPESRTRLRTLRFYLSGQTLDTKTRYVIQLALAARDYDSLDVARSAGTAPAGLRSPEAVTASPVYDAFLEFTNLRDLNIKIGQYFVPFDRARTIREFALQMVDRPNLVQQFTLDRDAGVSVGSRDLFGLGGWLGYNLGVFSGRGRNRCGYSETSGLYTSRIFFTPFRSFDHDSEGDLDRNPAPRLMVGIAVARAQNSDRERIATGNFYNAGTMDSNLAAADLIFKQSGFYLQMQGNLRDATSDRLKAANSDYQHFTQSGHGYLIQTSQMITGRMELVARYGYTIPLSGTDPAWRDLLRAQRHEFGSGWNYYENAHFFKWQIDYNFRGSGSELDHHEFRCQPDFFV